MDTSDQPSILLEGCRPQLDTLPDRSHGRYKNSYDVFLKWQKMKGITSFDEPVLLTYFCEASKKYKPSTLWSMYSMLKSTLVCNNNINISTYSRLIAFLKLKSDGFESKKTKVFSDEEINKFLLEAPDEHFLAIKTVLVFGVAGGCRGDEITNIKTNYVTAYGNEVIVRIPGSFSNGPKIFPISGEFAKVVQKYMKLRPAKTEKDRFFLQYRQGDCRFQVMGKNKVANAPKEIAKFLNLANYESYTVHSFKRSGGASTEIIKPYGQSKSTNIAEGCVQESVGQKRKLDSFINKAISLPPSSNALNECNVSKRKATSTVTSSDNSATSRITSSENSTDFALSSDSSVNNINVRSQREHTTTYIRVSSLTDNDEDKQTIFHFHNCNNISISIMK